MIWTKKMHDNEWWITQAEADKEIDILETALKTTNEAYRKADATIFELQAKLTLLCDIAEDIQCEYSDCPLRTEALK